MTEIVTEITAEMAAALKEETRVVFSMEDYDDLYFLIDDSTPEPTSLADRAILFWKGLHGRMPTADEVSVEDEEEDTEQAIYCQGIDRENLLRLVLQALPEGFTAAVVPVPEDALHGAEIAISRR